MCHASHALLIKDPSLKFQRWLQCYNRIHLHLCGFIWNTFTISSTRYVYWQSSASSKTTDEWSMLLLSNRISWISVEIKTNCVELSGSDLFDDSKTGHTLLHLDKCWYNSYRIVLRNLITDVFSFFCHAFRNYHCCGCVWFWWTLGDDLCMDNICREPCTAVLVHRLCFICRCRT